MERLWFYDCNSKWDFPSSPELKIEEQHSQDVPSQISQMIPEQHSFNMDETYDFFRDTYKRKSFDNKSATVKFYSRYGDAYDNAFWDGEQMVFGQGGDYFNDFASIIDVVGHEFTHAVTQYSADLVYENQPGALNESISDIFGSMIKQYLANKTADEADWLIGEGIWKGQSTRYKALRSMSNPGTAYPGDDQPSHMRDYYQGSDDNGGVHINSGIPNKAFYEYAIAVGGNSWEKAGLVWYKTLEDQRIVRKNADFKSFARGTYTVAKRYAPDTASKLKEAWKTVGITF